MKENRRLKAGLIIQSFAPLFLLLFIKNVNGAMPRLIKSFFDKLFKEGIATFTVAIAYPAFWSFMLTMISVVWIILACIIYLAYRGMQNSGFASKGEMISIIEKKQDVGLSFLVSYVLPLMVDDVQDLRAFLLLTVMLALVLSLLIRSNLFYQNPILALLGYKVFSFTITNPAKDIEEHAHEKNFIGITYGKEITVKIPIKRKYIANDVFMIYND